MATNLYAPPKARLADVIQHEDAPALWNPGAARRHGGRLPADLMFRAELTSRS
jgi:hypothetical protein